MGNTQQKPKFDWNNFKTSDTRISVHCRTEQEAQNFRRMMHEHGMKWCNGHPYTDVEKETDDGGFELYGDRTVYDNKGQYGSIDYTNSIGGEIVMYSSYDWT